MKAFSEPDLKVSTFHRVAIFMHAGRKRGMDGVKAMENDGLDSILDATEMYIKKDLKDAMFKVFPTPLDVFGMLQFIMNKGLAVKIDDMYNMACKFACADALYKDLLRRWADATDDEKKDSRKKRVEDLQILHQDFKTMMNMTLEGCCRGIPSL